MTRKALLAILLATTVVACASAADEYSGGIAIPVLTQDDWYRYVSIVYSFQLNMEESFGERREAPIVAEMIADTAEGVIRSHARETVSKVARDHTLEELQFFSGLSSNPLLTELLELLTDDERLREVTILRIEMQVEERQ